MGKTPNQRVIHDPGVGMKPFPKHQSRGPIPRGEPSTHILRTPLPVPPQAGTAWPWGPAGLLLTGGSTPLPQRTGTWGSHQVGDHPHTPSHRLCTSPAPLPNGLFFTHAKSLPRGEDGDNDRSVGRGQCKDGEHPSAWETRFPRGELQRDLSPPRSIQPPGTGQGLPSLRGHWCPPTPHVPSSQHRHGRGNAGCPREKGISMPFPRTRATSTLGDAGLGCVPPHQPPSFTQGPGSGVGEG